MCIVSLTIKLNIDIKIKNIVSYLKRTFLLQNESLCSLDHIKLAISSKFVLLFISYVYIDHVPAYLI